MRARGFEVQVAKQMQCGVRILSEGETERERDGVLASVVSSGLQAF